MNSNGSVTAGPFGSFGTLSEFKLTLIVQYKLVSEILRDRNGGLQSSHNLFFSHDNVT